MTTPPEYLHEPQNRKETRPPASKYITEGGVGVVNGGARTVATDSQGPMHAGDGDQHNSYYSLSLALDGLHTLSTGRSRKRTVGRVTNEESNRILRCFVRPPGFGDALAAARAGSTIVLSGDPGSGRRAAAIRLLQDDPEQTRAIRVLPDSDEERPYLDADSVEDGEHLLLELSSTIESIVAHIRTELASYCETVAERGGRLVVVVSESQEAALRAAFPPRAIRIKRPNPVDVLRGHLSYNGVSVPPASLDQKVRARLETYTADEAAHLADLVTQHKNHARAGESTDLGELIRRSTNEESHWVSTAGESIEKNGGLRQRAVLIAAAMLHGCSTDAAFEATEKLLACASSSEEQEDPPRLARQGFIKQLQDLDVEVRPDRTLAFTGFNYDAAVRNRFWDEFPDQHESFEQWVEECSRHRRSSYTALNPATLAVLGQRFAEQHIRTRGPTHLLAVTEKWRNDARRSGHHHSDLTLGVLEAMLADEQAAPSARERMRVWSIDSRLAEPLAELLIVVCERTLAPTHPQQAVVRLRHLARHGRRRVAEQAQTALIGLATRDRALHRVLIRTLANRLDRALRQKLPLFEADRRLLWRATDPSLLLTLGTAFSESPSRDERAALAAVMAEDTGDLRERTEQWLTAYSRDQRRAATLPSFPLSALPAHLDSFAAAAVEARRWTEVYAAALRFANGRGPRDERRRRAAELLIGRLRVLRGITPGPPYRSAARKGTQ